MVKKERLIEFVFLGNLYWAVQPRGFLERYCQSFLRFNWVNKVEKEVTPFFHFEKNVLRFLFTGKFCMVMQDLTVVYSEILVELSTSNLPVVDTESFGEKLERRINLCTF